MQNFPVVGIGAAVGGLTAFEAFFSGMPPCAEPGMAFVFVGNQEPEIKSIITGLVQRYTRMQISEVEDGMEVFRNCVYIIGPEWDLMLRNGALRLLAPSFHRGERFPIDLFFKSLAKDQRDRAIGIVLAGTGSDGTLGIRAIKAEGGMAMAQAPDSTEYDDMPRHAIASGLVDFELPPTEMPAKLMAYVDHFFGRQAQHFHTSLPGTCRTRQSIFNTVLKATGHDFSQYRSSSMHHRIKRRMALRQIIMLDEYEGYLQRFPAEVHALFHDLSSGATQFFRDPEVFKVLKKQIVPGLFAGKPPGSVVRVWSVGCSTGEEAYSLAILLSEHLDLLKQNYLVQVFATDIDSQAIAIARTGTYPAGIAADVTPERLARFFSAKQNGARYHINNTLRDMVSFAEQDVIKDPPFATFDLVSCRNLLIDLSSDLRKKTVSLLHAALRPDGVLLVGETESVADFGDIFAVLNHTLKFYRRRQATHSSQSALVVPHSSSLPERDIRAISADRSTAPGQLSFRALTERTILQLAAPTGALVNDQGDILYLHGRTGIYLEPPVVGGSVNNILEMAREGLREELTAAMRNILISGDIFRRTGLRVNVNGGFATVNLTITPVVTGPATTKETPLYLILLEEVVQASSNENGDSSDS